LKEERTVELAEIFLPDASTAVVNACPMGVSESTLSTDRGEKLRAFATAKIPIYWIVNLVDRQVEVYTGPVVDDYATRHDCLPGQQVPVVIDGLQLGEIAVDDILPSPPTVP